MKKLLCILLTFITYNLYGINTEFVWTGKILTSSNNPIPKASASIRTNQKNIIFIADEDGGIAISFNNYLSTDSITFTCIGFKPLTISCNELLKNTQIVLAEKTYNIGEVVVKPHKLKIINMGIAPLLSLLTSGQAYNEKLVLYIPANGQSGLVKKVRYNLRNSLFFSKGDVKHFPVRIRLYKKNPKNNEPGEDILKDIIIAQMPKHKKWLEVDLSAYNIVLPEDGIFVGLEIFSYEYYAKIFPKHQKMVQIGNANIFNSLCLGISRKKANNQSGYESWIKFGNTWIYKKDSNFIINIDVEI
ncbi:MAG: hypothetical protein Q8928_12705 [Bacteroidota bacterium]|nr:hypothetical protein [Bacteroidota bacterium]